MRQFAATLLLICGAYLGLFAQTAAPVKTIIDNFENPEGYVVVIAHRGDWRNAPENSLLAIQNCIDMGVDMVEIDIRKTKDGHLILMHDETLDRTTDGTGKVANWTLDSIRTLHLRNGQGRITRFTIPTLEEAMKVAKGKIMINLDKCYDYFEEAYEILEKTGTTDQVVMKGKKTFEEVVEDFDEYLGRVYFMPIIDLANPKADQIFETYYNELEPFAYELLFNQDSLASVERIQAYQEASTRPWVNSIFPHLCADHDDDVAVTDVKASYDWLIARGFNMIQTDRPALLLAYLRERGLHL